MNLLLCAATELELAPTVQFVREHTALKEVDVLITGVGLTAATYHLTKKNCTKKPHFIVQAGVAGCFNTAIALEDMVVVESEIIGDAVVMENGFPATLFDLNLAAPNEPPWTDGQLKNNLSLLQQSGLKVVSGITVNEITTNPDRIQYYRNNLNVSVETLEGAALHYVALMEGIPFLQLRAISNYVGERDKKAWKLKEAITILNTELQRLLAKLFEL